MLETKHIEYKQKATPELEKEVVAFLNSEGGAIYIGIDKEGHTVGVTSPDTLQLELKDRFKNNIVPSCMGLFDILAEKREGKGGFHTYRKCLRAHACETDRGIICQADA